MGLGLILSLWGSTVSQTLL